MIFYQDERVALFIDGSNLYATAKALGFDIDYKRLLGFFRKRSRLVRAIYYTALMGRCGIFADSAAHRLASTNNGYKVVTKRQRSSPTRWAGRKVKAIWTSNWRSRSCSFAKISTMWCWFLRRWRFPLADRRRAGQGAGVPAWYRR